MIFIEIMVVLLIILIIGLIFLARFFTKVAVQRNNSWYSKKGHALMNPSIQKSSSLSEMDKNEIRQNKERDAFWETTPSTILSLTSSKNYMLYATLFQQDSHLWFLGIHGYRSTGKTDMGFIGSKFYKYGYNILIPDLQAHGKSEGSIIGLGALETEDIELWMKKILEIDSDATIVLMGGSMGATSVMMSSNNNFVNQHTHCFIADCGYSSIKNILNHLVKDAFRLPKFPLVSFVMNSSKSIANYSFSSVNTEDSLKTNFKPLLIIHGTGDKFVPPTEANINYDATKGPKQLLLVKNAPHLSSFIYEEETYFSTIFDFIKENSKEV